MRTPLTQSAAETTLLCSLIITATGRFALADIEYNSAILFNTPPPAYDLSQARPALELHRSATGAINSLGQLTGTGDAGSGLNNRDARPFFYDPAEHTAANLGDLTDDFADQAVLPRNDASNGLGLNDLGWVVGLSSTGTTPGTADNRPFLWFDGDANHANTPGEMHELALNPGASFGSALRVNNNGRTLINGDTGLYHATLSLNLGVVSETSARGFIANPVTSADINNTGDTTFNTGNTGYVWRDLNEDDTADPNEIAQIPLMSEASISNTAFGINDAGQVVGMMRNEHNKDIAYIWTDLDGDNVVDWNDANSNGYFGSDETSNEVVRFHGDAGGISADTGSTFLFDINDHGLAVGGYFDASERNAFIYDTTHGMRFLNDLVDPAFALDLRQADAINNAGRIAAIGKDLSGTIDQLVLLTPISTTLQGDLDSDGFVGITDLNIVLSNWNQSVPPGDPSVGDPSADGFVGIEDLNVVLGNWNAGTPPGDTANIPEPGAVALLGVGGLMLLRRGYA